MFKAWRQAEIIMGAVPSCDTRRIFQAKDLGDPQAVIHEANVSGINGLLGVVRGRIVGYFSWGSMEAIYLFCDVERLRRREWSQPQIGLTAVWDYLEKLPGRIKVIGEVSVLPSDLEILAERAKDLVFGDLREEIAYLQSQVENILYDWSWVNLAEAEEIVRRIDELPGLIISNQEFSTMVKGSRDGGDRWRGKRSGKAERRCHNQNWRQRLYPKETEEERVFPAAS